MRMQTLGCSGAIAQGCHTTSFLLDDDLLVDAGTGLGLLTVEEMLRIEHVIITHTHLDHIAYLPLYLDAVVSARIQRQLPPVSIWALPQTLSSLKTHIFNDTIWPDFTVIPTVERPLIQFCPIQVGEQFQAGRHSIEVLPAVHTVPAVGFAVKGDTGHWVFTGDTGPNPAFWQRINQLHVAMLVIETAFSNDEQYLATLSQHLSPATLAAELAQFQLQQERKCPVYISHTKPSEAGKIMDEIAEINQLVLGGLSIHWLSTGQVFHI